MYEEYVELVKGSMSQYRFHHSMCVADRARELAKKHGLDENKAYLAGILHDITKEMPREEQVELIKKYGYELTDIDLGNYRILHQISGAVYVKHVLGIDDADIIGGIRYHTTGRADMTLFEQIIYLADFTSADRNYPDVEVMRTKTDENIFDAMLYSLKYVITEVVSNNRTLHPDTLYCYNWVLDKMKGLL